MTEATISPFPHSSHSRPEPSGWLSLEESRVAYWTHGSEDRSAPFVLFVHGWPLHGGTYKPVVDAMLERGHSGFRSAYFDLPAAGLSSGDASTLGIQPLSRAVAKVATELSRGAPIILVGHDSGGSIARYAADQLGDQVAGMVLGNTEIPKRYTLMFKALFKLTRIPFAKAIWSFLLRRRTVQMEFALASASTKAARKRIRKTFFAPLAKDPARLDAAIELASRVSPSDFDALDEVHARLKAPVRLIWGARDPWFPEKDARSMLDQFAGRATFRSIPKAGLLVHEDAPEAFAEEVLAAVERVTKAARRSSATLANAS